MKREVLESLNRLYKLAESQAIKIDMFYGGHCFQEQIGNDYDIISEELNKKNNVK